MHRSLPNPPVRLHAFRQRVAALLVAFLAGACGGGGGNTPAPGDGATGGGGGGGGTVEPTVPPSLAGIAGALDAAAPTLDGSNAARSATILQWDGLLWATDETQPTPPDIVQFYAARMARVAREIQQPVASGLRIWQMYNHGFIVKTPTVTFAFDLVDGKSSWNSPAWTVRLSDEILDRIDVLFVTHEHGDHYDETERIPAAIKARGGAVVYPALSAARANVTHAVRAGQQLTLGGLSVRAWPGPHVAYNLVYEVVTPSGHRVVHTGDNEETANLPELEDVHVLLLNGWTDGDSRPGSHVYGMKNALNRLRPDLMIPGHFEELAHPKSDSAGRYAYEGALTLQDSTTLRSRTVVLTWGERLDYDRPVCPGGQVRIYSSCVPAGSAPSDVVPESLSVDAQFATATNLPTGLATAGTSLWVTGRAAAPGQPGLLARYDRSTGALLGSVATPGTFPVHVMHDGTQLWLADYIDGAMKVARLAADGRLQASFAAPLSSPAHQVGGLAGDGTRLYFAERVNNGNTGEVGSRIVTLDPATGQVTGTVFSSASAQIQGLTLFKGSLWFIDQTTTEAGLDVRLVNVSTAGTVLSSRPLRSSNPAASMANAQGLTAGHDYLQFLKDSVAYRVDLY